MAAESSNRVEIELAALRHNYLALQGTVGAGVKLMAMVKADGYGHGLVPVATALAAVGAKVFGVAEVEEGIRLREAGVAGEIVIVLGSRDYPEIIHHGLSPVVFDLFSLRELSAAAVSARSKVGVHLKVDVGMGRLGIMPEEVPVFVANLAALPGLFLAGILSHLPFADREDGSAPTLGQCRNFAALAADIRVRHLANSAALLRYPASHYEMARPGIALYGYYPGGGGEWTEGAPTLRPAMSFYSRVIQVKSLPPGAGVSYGHTFVTARPTRLAVLPVGYADGYLRYFSNRGEVLIRGQRAPVLGRVCMNVCMVDVTDIPGVVVGDEVVLLGRHTPEALAAGIVEGEGGWLGADEVAAGMDSISYEILCLFGNSNRRIYR